MSTFEEAITAAITNRFFEPVPVHNTAPDGTPTIYLAPAPAMNVAYQLFEAKKREILEAVEAKLDIDALATKIAAQVVEELVRRPDAYRYQGHFAGKDIQAKIVEAVIEKLAQDKADELRAQMAEG